MQFVILGLLLAGPLSLYDVHKRFTAGISLFYRASFGSISRALEQLVAQGWAEVEDAVESRRGKKLYSITPAGQEAWRGWMLGPLTGSDLETTMLARVYLLGLLPHDRERRQVVQAIRARLSEDAADLATLADELDARDVVAGLEDIYRFQRATLDYGIRSHALARAWLDDLEAARS